MNVLEWLISCLRNMTDEQKRELAKAIYAKSPLLYQLMENSNLTVRSVDELIEALEKMSKKEEHDERLPLERGTHSEKVHADHH